MSNLKEDNAAEDEEPKETFADAQRIVASMISRTKANYREASRSCDTEWEQEAAGQLMMLYEVCERLGIDYGPKVIGK